MTRRRLVYLAFAAAGLAALFGLVVAFHRNSFDAVDAGRSPVHGQYVGQTWEAILGKVGKPSSEREGHYGNPPVDYIQEHSLALTLIYARPYGVLYLCFEKVDGLWVCFSSDWVPWGWVLD